MKSITCRFGNLIANQDVDFDLTRGEIHALLGENGAGKTTLMSILYGLYQPETGEIYVRGERANMKSPLDAMNHGIAMVHQHFLLTPPHTVTENIIVGLKSSKRIFLDTVNAEQKIVELSTKYGLKADPGAIRSETGEIYVRGERANMKSPLDAMNHGIAMVHQHFLLTPPHTVTENIIVGLKSSKRIFLDTVNAEQKIVELSTKYGLKANPGAIVGNLSVGEQQRVEIIKALYRDIEILILDEPTSMLTPQEEESLFAALQSMVDQGLSIIFITHKLREVMAVSSRVTVLKNGKLIGTVKTSDTNESDLARMMVGRSVVQQMSGQRGGGGTESEVVAAQAKKSQAVLEIKNVSALNNSKILFLKDLSLELRKGEILGIAGVDGNGQSELAEVIAGLRKIQGGQIIMDRRATTNLSPREIREWGLAYIPEDRLNKG